MQGLAQKQLGFLRVFAGNQQVRQRKIAARIVRHCVQPLAEHGFGFRQVTQLLQMVPAS